MGLLLLEFALPFLLLLSRGLKESSVVLARVAMLVVLMQITNVIWLVVPAFHPKDLRIHWMDIVAPIAFGGIWLAVFLFRLSARPLLPLHVLPVRHPRRHYTEHTELEHA